MIERTYRVTTSKVITLRVPEDRLTDDDVEAFNSSIYKCGLGDEGREEMLKHAAEIISEHGNVFVEGIGEASCYSSESPTISYREEPYESYTEVELIDE
jgi:hypothetical protein